MSTEELQKRVADLEKERDMWREMAMRLLPFLPAPPQPVLIPQIAPVTPWPTPFPEPSWPWAPVITWTSDKTEPVKIGCCGRDHAKDFDVLTEQLGVHFG